MAPVAGHPLAAVVEALAGAPRPAGAPARHSLAPSPADAELILLCGSFTARPRRLTEHPLYRAFPERCAVYTGDDHYCPLAPGVYTSPRRGLSTAVGRVRSHAFASSYGDHGNLAVQAAAARFDPGAPGPASLLLSFEGSASSRLRRRLFALDLDPGECAVRDSTGAYDHFDHDAPARAEGQARYVRTMLDSAFVLCPRGVGTGTLRLFEAMSLGRAPVVLSDRYVLPRGPDWAALALRVPERHVGRVAAILRAERPGAAARGAAARRAWERHFAPDVLFDELVDAAAQALAADRRWRPVVRALRPAMVLALWVRRDLRRDLSGLAVGVRRAWRAQRRRTSRSRTPA